MSQYSTHYCTAASNVRGQIAQLDRYDTNLLSVVVFSALYLFALFCFCLSNDILLR